MTQETTGAAVITAATAFATVFSTLNGWAVMGACFGCFFFLSASSLMKRMQRVYLIIFSWGIGYAAGEYWGGSGPPFDRGAMFISAAATALAAIFFTALFHMMSKDGPMPPWLENLLDRIPFFQKKG